MGQRFQIVFVLPPVYMNENNPNNRSEKVITFHSQWLFGKGAIITNLRILQRLKEAIEKKRECGIYGETKEDFINHFLERTIRAVIKWASVQDLHNEVRISESQVLDYSKEQEKPREEQRTFGDLLKSEDNNNGFFICRIDKELNMDYSFISGKEDTDICEIKTPKEYLNLFYTDKTLEKEEEGEITKPMEEFIQEYSKFKQIPQTAQTALNNTLEVLNE